MRRWLALLTLAAACGGSTEPKVDLSKPTGLTPVSQTNLTLIAGQSTTVSVRVVNASGTAVNGAHVDFSATSGGTVGSPGVTTSADGLASTQWTVAKVAGQQVLTATVSGTTFAVAISATVTIPLSGTWTGSVGSQLLTLNIVESGGVVSGNGTLTNTPTGTRALVASGTLASSTVNITMTSGTIQPFSLQGTVLGASIVGTLNGSGFTNNPITMTKQ